MGSDNQSNFINIEEVFNTLKKEIQLNTGPQSLPHDFYQNIANMISKLNSNNNNNNENANSAEDEAEEIDDDGNSAPLRKEKMGNKISDQIKSNLLDLLVRSVSLLFVYRYKKTFNMDKIQETFDYSNLTDEEKYVLYGDREREHRISIILNTLFEGKPKTLENIVSSINQNFVILRFLDSMEQFVGVNMNKYGPFKKEDVAILPFENARSIIENNKAIEINLAN
jgi:DNA replication factor GINS